MYDPFSDGHVLTSVVIFDTRFCYSSSSRYMKLFYVKDDISLDFLIRKGYDGRRLAECFSPILILQTMEPIIIAARNCTSIYIYANAVYGDDILYFSHYPDVYFQIGLTGASCKDWIVRIKPRLVLISSANSHASITESAIYCTHTLLSALVCIWYSK